MWFDGDNLINITNIYIQPIIKYSKLDENIESIIFGGKGAIIFNYTISIGCVGNVLVSDAIYYNKKLIKYSEYKDVIVNIGYGGLVIEYIFFNTKYINFSIPFLIGGGQYQIKIKDDELNNNSSSTNFWCIESGINFEFKLFKNLSFNTSLTYLKIFNNDKSNNLNFNYNANDFSGFLPTASFKIYFN